MNGYDHPAFEPYRELLAELDGRRDADALNRLAERLDVRLAHTGAPLRFARLEGGCKAADYELGIAESGIVPTRPDNLHDFFNALVWLRFPWLKSALNRRHAERLATHPEERRQRGRLRDQLTLLDENGMLVVAAEPPLLERLRARHWVELFWENRETVARAMRFVVVGHGLLEKCLTPFPGLTAKCLLLDGRETAPEALDALAAATVLATENLELPPLPIAGVPGWDGRQDRRFYENTAIFRLPRRPAP